MIGVGIIGCANLHAAELVRILINHPDVELMWVQDAGLAGMRLEQVVPGVVGECNLTIEREGTLDDVDVVYLCGNRAEAGRWLTKVDIKMPPEETSMATFMMQ